MICGFKYSIKRWIRSDVVRLWFSNIYQASQRPTALSFFQQVPREIRACQTQTPPPPPHTHYRQRIVTLTLFVCTPGRSPPRNPYWNEEPDCSLEPSRLNCGVGGALSMKPVLSAVASVIGSGPSSW